MTRGILCIVFLLGLSTCAIAQTTVKVQWDPNPPAESVTNYKLYVDLLVPAVTVPTTVDPACSCIQSIVTLAAGSHTVKVTAVNTLISGDPTTSQEGPPASLTFSINPGAQIKNVKVTK